MRSTELDSSTVLEQIFYKYHPLKRSLQRQKGDSGEVSVTNIKTVDESNSVRVLVAYKHTIKQIQDALQVLCLPYSELEQFYKFYFIDTSNIGTINMTLITHLLHIIKLQICL